MPLSGTIRSEMGLVDDVLAGNQRALARLASMIENDDPSGREGLAKLYPHTGRAHVIGITGPPGAGKSTLIDRLIGCFRQRGKRVGVIAVDPTSPLTGGATLGDRVRMIDRHSDDGVFIRSMASRGRHGGLAPATCNIAHLLDAAGYDVVMIETVGVGQEETSVAAIVQTVVLVQVPATGDGVQLLKAGLLECADIYVVNKADLPGSEDLLRGLRSLVGASLFDDQDWRSQVVRCSAEHGEGIDRLAEAIASHWRFLQEHQRLEKRRREIAQAEITYGVIAGLTNDLAGRARAGAQFTDLVSRVADRTLSPTAAVETIIANWQNVRS